MRLFVRDRMQGSMSLPRPPIFPRPGFLKLWRTNEALQQRPAKPIAERYRIDLFRQNLEAILMMEVNTVGREQNIPRRG